MLCFHWFSPTQTTCVWVHACTRVCLLFSYTSLSPLALRAVSSYNIYWCLLKNKNLWVDPRKCLPLLLPSVFFSVLSSPRISARLNVKAGGVVVLKFTACYFASSLLIMWFCEGGQLNLTWLLTWQCHYFCSFYRTFWFNPLGWYDVK